MPAGGGLLPQQDGLARSWLPAGGMLPQACCRQLPKQDGQKPAGGPGGLPARGGLPLAGGGPRPWLAGWLPPSASWPETAAWPLMQACGGLPGCCHNKMASPGRSPPAGLLLLRRGLLHPLLACVLDAQRVRPRRPAGGNADLRDNMTRKFTFDPDGKIGPRELQRSLHVTFEALCWDGSGQRQRILDSRQQRRKISWLLPAATC